MSKDGSYWIFVRLGVSSQFWHRFEKRKMWESFEEGANVAEDRVGVEIVEKMHR